MNAKRHTLANALRVAADQYDADADIVIEEHLIEGFKRQAVEARALADSIEQAASIRLED